MTDKELKTILENHQHWLRGDCEDWKKMRADLYEANLCGADLRRVDLRRAKLREANLYEADLRGANLRRADLRRVDLRRAKLRGADLYEADLYEANLRRADLRRVDLRRAKLYGADLYEADLRGANLRGANLCGADNIPYVPMICPEKGAFIGFKKAGGKIVELQITDDAKRSSATTRKCRCNKAKVISITNLNGSECDETEVASQYDENFVYKVGETVAEPNFCEDRWQECAAGIHFFINRQEAVDY